MCSIDYPDTDLISWRENVLAAIIEFYFFINEEWFNMIECDKWIKIVNFKRGNKMWKVSCEAWEKLNDLALHEFS